ncbi:PREDICTED: RNA-binding motif protein, X-linked-like-2 [Tarenaya hassleriana]|uniref:RNA-binding motif protein, X-linked-like-2 n=1 Tax=Tarenaya hassleriana TaxID=28532 RepID=UPI00053C248B|nr:PREDICTED: RNA-binding motif protein, X-linked-like-2 [Tarenaya hassleriana]
MNPMTEENVDYGSNQKIQYQGSGTIPALADEELMGEEDEYDDLYSDVNVGENFFQAHQPQPSAQGGGGTGNGGVQAQISNISEPRMQAGAPSGPSVHRGSVEGKYQNDGGHNAVNGRDMRSDVYPQASSVGAKASNDNSQTNKMVPQGSASAVLNIPVLPGKTVNEPEPVQNSYVVKPQASHQVPPVNQMSGNPNANHAMMNKSPILSPVENGNTMLFVGELHWWTTDAELESVLSQYGRVKEIKFFDERACGKSKGYCQVEFYDAAVASACKEGMNGYIFSGRACVVAFASPETLKQMGASFTGRNQGQNQLQNRRPLNEGMGRGGNNMNMQSVGDGGRNYGRGGFGRGGQGMNNRGGPWGGGGMRGRGLNNMGVSANGVGAGPYGPGLAGHAFGGPAAGLMHPQGMMGAGFDPTFMGRGGGYGGFSGLAFPGMPPSFPGINALGMVGVAPHVNPAFFGRGMGAAGMGMMGSSGMDGPHAGMWSDASGYGGDDGGSEYGYEDENQEKDAKPNTAASRDKERAPERDWSENSDRKYREEREYKGHKYHEEKDNHHHRGYRQRDRDSGYDDDEWERGQSSSKSRSRSRMGEDDHRSRSRDADNGKRRRSD